MGKVMRTSQDNFNHIKRNAKSLQEQLNEKTSQHPEKQNEIYATIGVDEIVKGLTQEDFRRFDKEKAVYLR
jgi:hypothetical protein